MDDEEIRNTQEEDVPEGFVRLPVEFRMPGDSGLIRVRIPEPGEKPMHQILAEQKELRDAFWSILDKAEWIAAARSEANFGEPESCEICGMTSRISHAHHLVPLAEQYDRGFITPSQRHAWLCPNHHTMIHIFLRYRDLRKCDLIFELTDKQIDHFAELIKQARAPSDRDGGRFRRGQS